MNFIRVKTPWLAKKIFSSCYWDFPSKEKTIYLTFDDGPTPIITPQVLEILEQYNAKATFFCIGKNVTAHPEIAKRILDEQHAIGNHTYDHINGWKTDDDAYIKNTLKASKIIDSNLFRPPYGRLKPSQGKLLQKAGYKLIMWDVVAIDWDDSKTKEFVLQNVLNNAVSGSIVVLHDSLKASENMLYALPKILAHFTKEGYVFKKIELE